MNIQTALSNARSFSELLPIAQHAEVNISFWGSRYVCVNGYQGTLEVDALASKTLELLRQTNYEFSEEEREVGKRLAGRIDNVYHDDMMQCINAPCFTQITMFFITFTSSIIDWIRGVPSTQFEWYGLEQRLWHVSPPNYNSDFNYYTRAQLQAVFGITPEEADRRGYRRQERNGVSRWSVS